jgi:hypothetical protein
MAPVVVENHPVGGGFRPLAGRDDAGRTDHVG